MTLYNISNRRRTAFTKRAYDDGTGLQSLGRDEHNYRKVYKNERDLDTWKPSEVATVPIRYLLPPPPTPMNI